MSYYKANPRLASIKIEQSLQRASGIQAIFTGCRISLPVRQPQSIKKPGQRVIKRHRICYNCCNTNLILWKTKEECMKKSGLIIALFLLFSSVSAGAVPDDVEFRKGLKFYNSRNYKAAAKQLQEYVKNKPDPTAYYLIGYSLYELGKFSEANEYFSQAYLIDPEFSLEKAGLIEKTPEKPASPKE